jgi:hypothetical protein
VIGLELVRHGAHQQALRHKWYLQEPDSVHLDVTGAVEHLYRAPSMTELSALFLGLQRAGVLKLPRWDP